MHNKSFCIAQKAYYELSNIGKVYPVFSLSYENIIAVSTAAAAASPAASAAASATPCLLIVPLQLLLHHVSILSFLILCIHVENLSFQTSIRIC